MWAPQKPLSPCGALRARSPGPAEQEAQGLQLVPVPPGLVAFLSQRPNGTVSPRVSGTGFLGAWLDGCCPRGAADREAGKLKSPLAGKGEELFLL